MEKPLKASDKWDGVACKNTLDDVVKQIFLESFGYTESYSLMNGRLIISTMAVGFALFGLVWDYLFPFPVSRPVLIVCVISYFILMGVLTAYTSYKEKTTFLVALEKDKAGIDPDNTWHVSSQLKRYDDLYELNITYIDGQTKKTRSAELSKSVACYYDENGYVCMDLFEPEIVKLHSTLTSSKKQK